jgi:hypothetical protein
MIHSDSHREDCVSSSRAVGSLCNLLENYYGYGAKAGTAYP